MKIGPMKIGINAWFLDQLTTGSGQYLAHLLAEYAAHDSEDAFLLCMGAGRRPLPSPHSHTPVSLSTLPPLHPRFVWQTLRTPFDGHSRHLAKLWFEQVSFPRACRRWGADLIHVPYWASPLLPGTPVLVTIHDLIPMLLPAYQGGAPGRLYNLLVAASARRAAWVLTDSEASRRDIVRHLHIPAHRVEAIPLAAHERFRPIQDPAILDGVRQKYGLPARYLLYLGGLDVRKNVPGILQAFSRLDAPGVAQASAPLRQTCAHERTHLVLAGQLPGQESRLFPDPRRIAARLGIPDRVHLAGWVEQEDKPALYSAALAFVFPSYYEGFGLPPLEAMACGTPVIVSNRSSLPEIVGQGGLCVDPDDVDALARAMRQVLDDGSLRDRLRTAGLAQAGRFNWQKTAQRTLSAYQRVSCS
jgi:glycosyltransferase involved in cell wall biosynthesis